MAFPWRGGGLRRPHFFLRRKKCGKESRLDLRSKGPLARCGSCRFGGMHSRAGCGGHHCRSKGLCLRSPARRLPRPLAPATVGVFASTGLGEFRRPGGESVFPWRGGGLRRPHFFLRRKKCGKESRLDLRSKGPLARCGSCRFGGMHSRAGCGGHHCRSKGLCLRSPARRLTRPLAQPR